jgi:hypothetical protein
VVFALLLLGAWWLGRSSTSSIHSVAQAVWAGAGALLALAINQPIGSADVYSVTSYEFSEDRGPEDSTFVKKKCLHAPSFRLPALSLDPVQVRNRRAR